MDVREAALLATHFDRALDAEEERRQRYLCGWALRRNVDSATRLVRNCDSIDA
jgi:hypothetical protein